jgi:predicted phage terminase large subunit-like protein
VIAPEKLSIRDRIALLPPEERAAYLDELSEEDIAALERGDWSVIARPEQLLPEGDWTYWFVRAGRGYGKTRMGAEGSKDIMQAVAPQCDTEGMFWALASPREGDVLRTQIEGESGLLRAIPPSWLINGNVSDSLNRGSILLKLLVDGIYPVTVEGFSARVLDSPRGRSFHGGWCDEPGTYADAHNGLDGDDKGESFMGNLLFTMRLQPFGGLLITGTPKNNKLIRQLRKLENLVETVGRTRDNLHNLAEPFRDTVVARYAGTRLGRQELDAEILEGVGDLFQRGWFRPLPAGEWPWPVPNADVRQIRYWDLASGVETDSNPNPDWTVGTRIVLDAGRRLYVIEHSARFRKGPGEREMEMARIAHGDGLGVEQVIEVEPGNAGTSQLHSISRELDTRGIPTHRYPEKGSISGKKEIRAEGPALAAQQQRVYLRCLADGDWAPWALDLLDEAEEFPNGDHDDIVDTLSGGWAYLREAPPGRLLHGIGDPAVPAQLPKPTIARRGPAAFGGGRLPSPGIPRR